MSKTREARLKDAAEMLWVVLVNVNGGDWTKQTQEWQEAAARWRDNYLAVMREFPPHKEECTPPEAPPEPPTPENPPCICTHAEEEHDDPGGGCGHRDRDGFSCACAHRMEPPEPERPAARCVWKLETNDDDGGVFAYPLNHREQTAGWWNPRTVKAFQFCPYCGQPLTVEDAHA